MSWDPLILPPACREPREVDAECVPGDVGENSMAAWKGHTCLSTEVAKDIWTYSWNMVLSGGENEGTVVVAQCRCNLKLLC